MNQNIFRPFTLNIRGRLVSFDRPAVMGILNVTPDSFYAGSRTSDRDAILARAAAMVAEGADIIDIGGYSSRPGAPEVSETDELNHISLGLEAVREVAPDIPVSVDTFRGNVARKAVGEWGADIINDISGGGLDSAMLPAVEELRAPYILMHMRGNPQTMSTLTDYADVTADVIAELSPIVERLALAGVPDIIIDPGFGFAKTLEQNYRLMQGLPLIARYFGRPVLAGVSRKSMITRLCHIGPEDALPGTVALNTYALLHGASILRVHDVAAARQTVDVGLRLINPDGVENCCPANV